MDLYDIAMKLIGPVQPTGDNGKDLVRLENMKTLTVLIDKLLGQVIDAAETGVDSHEASVRAIGQHAQNFLRALCEE